MLTNKYNLPPPFYYALQWDDYNKGDSDISVSTLIDSPMIAYLKKKFEKEIQRDVSDYSYILDGKAEDVVIENTEGPEILHKQRRLFATVEGVKISGMFDVLYQDWDGATVLGDLKRTSVWSIIKKNSKKWEAQLNLYHWLGVESGFFEDHDIKIDRLAILASIRDWVRSKRGEDNYPPSPFAVLDIDLWTHEFGTFYIKQQLKLHNSHPKECSDADRWKTDDTWAVKKKNQKRALRVLKGEHDALRFIEDKFPEKLFIEHRPGGYRRCEDYCEVSTFCPIWRPM
jgi:hypothetical protein